MTWVTWRQQRTSTYVVTALLAAVVTYLVISALQINHTLHVLGCSANPSTCRLVDVFGTSVFGHIQIIRFFVFVPGIIGIFLGAPLVAREIETGTHRLAWTQSVTRRKWFGYEAGFALSLTLLATLVLAWITAYTLKPSIIAAADITRFDMFDVRGIAPVAYGLFALCLGICLGALIKRTIPAMAATLGGWVASRILILNLRPHFAKPLTAFTSIVSPRVPGGNDSWTLGQNMVDKTGHALAPHALLDLCGNGAIVREDGGNYKTIGKTIACAQQHGIRFEWIYQPASRYWRFQWTEAGIFLALSVICMAIATWRVTKRYV